MRNRFAILSVLALGSVAVAHADTITGGFSSSGSDKFTLPAGVTPGTITFINYPNSAVTGNGTPDGFVMPTVSGTFATYFGTGGGETVTYLPGLPDETPVDYSLGNNSVLANTSMTFLSLFTISGGGETFTFDLTNYEASYVVGNATNTNPGNGCNLGYTCLNFSGQGYYTGTGVATYLYGQDPGTVTFTTQYSNTANQGTDITSFSASTIATGSPVPEPSSLLLLGTGLIGIAGAARRRFKA